MAGTSRTSRRPDVGRSELPALLTVHEAALRLRVSDDSVRRRIRDHTLSAVRFGGILRVPASELERVLAIADRPRVRQ